MDSHPTPLTTGIIYGTLASALFWILFVGWIALLHDAQGGIGLILSPFFAVWFGGSVGLIVNGWLTVRRSQKNADIQTAFAVLSLAIGCAGLVTVTAFITGEINQATHPRVVTESEIQEALRQRR